MIVHIQQSYSYVAHSKSTGCINSVIMQRPSFITLNMLPIASIVLLYATHYVVVHVPRGTAHICTYV